MPPITWIHVTRALGVIVLLYGMFGDHTPERATIIIGGFALLGIGNVVKSEPKE